MMNYNDEKTVIDLRDSLNISDLGMKITKVLESNDTANKNLYLKLGKIDLKQSQLLSIKALIEAMQAKITGLETASEITETSAIGLGLIVKKTSSQPESNYREAIKETVEPIENSEELSSFSQLKKMNSIGDFVSDTKTLSEVQDENLKEETEEFLKEAESDEDSVEQTEQVLSTQDEIQNALDITFGAGVNIGDNIGVETKSEKTETLEEETKKEDVFAPLLIQEKIDDYEVTETREKSEEEKYVLLDTEGITPEGVELIKSNTSDLPTLYLTQTLRSGQTVSYEGNIFLIGDAHPGSEINATGDITIWGILGGIVHAGSKGNTDAKVRALKLNPIQLRIANLYSRRNDTVNVPYVQKSNEFTPEEARIEKEQIVIYKTLRRED